jgi:hypothetical protein
VTSARAEQAKAWFDQFMVPGWPPDNWPEKGQWCARHWAPAPALGANGIGAAVELQKIWLEELAPPTPRGDYKALNDALQKAGHICCTLGDERMYDLWEKWPPVV